MITVPTVQAGAWFLLPESRIRTGRQGKTFSPKRGNRPVILAEFAQGIPATIFPRSTQSDADSHRRGYQQRRWPHEKHDHPEFPDCRVNKDGYVIDAQYHIDNSVLSSYSPRCIEPENTGLLEKLAEWMSIDDL